MFPAKYSTITLCKSPELFLRAVLSSLVLCSANCSFLDLPGHPASSQLKNTPNCLGYPTQSRGVEFLSEQQAEVIVGLTPLVCHLSMNTAHCCLMSNVLKTIVSRTFILFSDGRINLGSVISSWLEAKVLV